MLPEATRVLVLLASLHWTYTSACVQGRVPYEPRSFLGYTCEDDCERHKAGFAWAVRRQVGGAAACQGLGAAEAEGCRAWTEEGRDARAAGFRWAVENEIAAPCRCDGAGRDFRAGCLRHLAPLSTPSGGRVAPKRFPARRTAGKLRR